MHISPRDVIGIQIFANMLGLPINCASSPCSLLPAQCARSADTDTQHLRPHTDGVMRWIIDAKFDVLTGIKPDLTNVWTAQDFKVRRCCCFIAPFVA